MKTLRTPTRTPTRKTALAIATLLALGAAPAEQSLAATCTWNPVTGNWSIAANWSCGGVPTGVDSANVGSGLAVTVTGSQGPTSLSNAGTVNIDNNSGLTLLGTNLNNGVINLQSGGNFTDLSFSGIAALNGSGTVNLSNTTANRILGSGATTLTIGGGQTVQGAGQWGAGSALALVNNGTIAATQAAGMVINTTAAVTNNSVLRADGGTLVLQNTGLTQGAAGTLNARNGSVVQLGNASVTGGSFTTASGGAIATGSGTTGNKLSGVTNAGTFNVVNNSGINLTGNFTNNGSLNLQSGGNFTDIVITGARTINGSGTINLTNATANRIMGAGAGDTLTLGSGQLLQGAGTIGAGSTGFALINQGSIVATQGAPLLINAAGGVTNTGVLRADGGTLQLQTTVNSGGGSIEARNGSQVQLLDGTTINNANFSATGAGSLITTVSGAGVTLGGGTVSGPMNLTNNSSMRLAGDLNYTGTLTMDSGGNFTDLRIDGARTINGAATVQMSNATANRFLAVNASGDSLTIGNGVTVQGSGSLGSGGTLALINNGSIIATQGAPMVVSTTAGLVNNGVMRADGGTLQFSNVLVDSANGSIQARNGSQVQLLNGTTINNANFSATGAGSLITTVSGASVTLGGGTVTGPMTVTNNSALRLNGDLTYNGTLSLASGGNFTDLLFSGTRHVGGTATIDLSNATANRIMAAGAGGDSVNFGSGITVQGAGQIGAGGNLNVVNNGTWIANLPAGLSLSTTGTATNNALIRADGATFTVTQTNLGQGANGKLEAINGGTVLLIGGSQITGGTFATASGGQIATSSGQQASIAGVTNTGALNVQNNASLVLNGTLVNNGALNLQSGGNFTDLLIGGNQAINGRGTITLSNATANRVYGVANGASLTLGSGQTLQGAGSIGAGQQFNFSNNGTVVGNQSSALSFNSTGNVTNQGQVRADGGNVLITGGTTFNQSGTGVLRAINGGVVTVNANAVIAGGTLATTDTGQFTTQSGHTATLANLANAGTFNVVNNAALRLQGTINNTGALNLNSGGNFTDLLISGAATLAGNGTTTLSNASANRVVADNAGAVLTVGNGQTLQGAGQLGAGTAMALVNQGNITANQSNALTVAMTGAVQNSAGGLMQATSGGTLVLNSALSNTGTLAANGGVVNANLGFTGTGTALITGNGQLNLGAVSTVGTLTHNGNLANGLALGTNNITVSSDYTNANAGSGNSFDRRAGVTGSGQILAGGNAAQAITGTNISNGNTGNGNTGNATLTINNVRVGSTTYNYQVANTGTTGPSLRGAIQTNVNGANLSDARLSGSGVTASNFNTGAPGSNTGNLGVTFTAANAGALAPLNGQVLNLTSNFSNIADQKLAIVLASGAAAYNAAVGQATSPVQVANQRVGGGNTATLAISNTAASGAFSEDLNVAVGGTSSGIQGSGAINGRLAGASSGGGAINVGVDTSTSGARTGTVTLNYQTAGSVNGTANGLGTASVGSQTVNVSGNVYQAAAGALQSAPLNFGTVQVGQSVSQNLVVRNTATGAAGFVEDLNASFGSASGTGASLISGSGGLSGIRAGSNSSNANGTMTVSVNTSAAGVVNGNIAVNYTTAGAVNGVSNGLGTASVGSQNYGVAGTINAVANVINQASPVVNNLNINFGALRVGAASPTSNVSVTNQATAAPQAALNASIASNGGPVLAGGSFNLLNPGATNASQLQVGLNTATAGNFTGANAGSATIAFVSDASNVGGCAPNCQMTLASQTVNVNGKVYTQAAGQLATPTLDFGIVRVGDTVSARNITVNNTAASTALNDTLRANLSGVGGAFSSGGSVSGVAAQGSGHIAVALNTGSAGVFSQTGAVGFLSHNPDMADVSAGPDAQLVVKGQVNNLANGVFSLLSTLGTLTQVGAEDFVLDLGNLALSNAEYTLAVKLKNAVSGPADNLSGLFAMTDADDFDFSGWAGVNGLGAGQDGGGMGIGLLADAVGLYQDVIDFNGFSTNGVGADLSQHRRLTIRANVIDPNGGGTVPEPGTLALLVMAALAAMLARRQCPTSANH